MRLKSLQIKGFKSFANETVLNFEHDVIGIVGPNGSGKSNIVDAMRWVLGEQKNKDLRLEQMKDVIFNGTAKRKKAYKAEVSVSFDNTKSVLPTPFNTVKITRRLYQTGESEYLLNDVKCRLKDIHNLFIDSGIGSSSYAIIELGMVDEILQDKDNARRRMFEQAAGISKYKTRKKESLQKLQLTSDDLERLEDLLAEIKSNLDQLRKQAKKAAKYKEIKEERKDKLLTFKKLELYKVLERQKVNESLLNKAMDSFTSKSASIHKLNSRIEEEKKTNLENEKHLSNSQKILSKIADEIAHLESDRKLQNQEIQFAKENIERIGKEIAHSEPELKEIVHSIEKLNFDIEGIETSLLKEQSDQKEIEDEYEELEFQIKTHDRKIDEQLAKRQILSGDTFNLEKDILILESKISQNAEQIEGLKGKNAGIEEQMHHLISRRKELEKKQELLKKEWQEIIVKESGELATAEDLNKAIADLDLDKAKLFRRLDAASNEKSLLQSMIESMEGYPEANKFVLQKINPNVPVLAEIIHIQEQQRTSIEAFLEPYLNYFIVHSYEQAHEIVAKMAESQKGKVSFFILDQIKKELKVKEIKDCISVLEFVDCEEEYEQLIRFLLHNVFLVQHNADIDLKEKKYYNDVVLIGDNGKYIHGEAIVRGGSVGLFEGKRTGRKSQLDQIDQSIRALKKEIASLGDQEINFRSQLKNLKLDDLKLEKDTKQNELKDIKYQFDLNDNDIDKINVEKENIKDKLKQLDSDLQALHQTIGTKKDKLSDCQKDLLSLEFSLDKESNEKNYLSDAFAQVSAKLNDKKLSVVRQENTLQQLIITREHKEGNKQEFKRKISSGRHELAQLENKKREASERIDKLEQILEEAYSRKREFENNLNAFEQNYFSARGEIYTLEEKLKKLNNLQNQDQILVNQYKELLVSLRFEKEKIEERVRVECSEDIYKWKIPEHLQPFEMEELSLELDRLEKRLIGFTEVNPLALEAFNELEKRYTNILEQRDDILTAKADLLKTIDEIEKKATELFLNAFEEVRKYFVKVFRSLFTEDDDCDLLLIDSEDPLNSEIEILAKPKGKRPRSLSQLSGGEKTLTATALLFALYLLKPAPFCIFDEVDAPLDDNNVQKFANIIRAFSKESQFLMITHNKLTMAEVDILYGIFMQEKGVSQVAPVDVTMLHHDKRISAMLK